MLSLADRDLIARDTALPGLATLLDPATFAGRLAEAIPALEGARARIHYLRYKPGANCLARFQLELDGQVIHGHAKTYGADASAKFTKACQRTTVPTPVGPGRALLVDDAIEVIFFPNDGKLKALHQLLEPAGRQTLLARLLPDSPDLSCAELHQLNYKPERRYVARLEVEGNPIAVLKLYSEREFQRARDNARALEPGKVLRLPAQLDVSRSRRALLFDWMTGAPFQQVIGQPDVDVAVVRQVGAAVAELHNQDGSGLETRTQLDIRDTVHAATKGMRFTCPALASLAFELDARLGALIAAEQAQQTAIHGDFYADQVLTADNHVAIIDLDNTVRGNPASDLGLFIAHLERNALTPGRPKAPVAAIRDALLEGYQTVRPLPSRERIDLHTAVGLVQLAPHHFRNREPEWDQRTAATLLRAQQIIDALPARPETRSAYPAPVGLPR